MISSNRPRPRTGTLGATTFAIEAFSFLASLGIRSRAADIPGYSRENRNFAICLKNHRFPTDNWEADQSLVGQFPVAGEAGIHSRLIGN
jgi:hypothetical protein